MNFNNPKYQVYALIIISVVISLSLNVIRSNPISMIAQDLKKIDNIDEIINSNEIHDPGSPVNTWLNDGPFNPCKIVFELITASKSSTLARPKSVIDRLTVTLWYFFEFIYASIFSITILIFSKLVFSDNDSILPTRAA